MDCSSWYKHFVLLLPFFQGGGGALKRNGVSQ
jgi:hypothetical protein